MGTLWLVRRFLLPNDHDRLEPRGGGGLNEPLELGCFATGPSQRFQEGARTPDELEALCLDEAGKRFAPVCTSFGSFEKIGKWSARTIGLSYRKRSMDFASSRSVLREWMRIPERVCSQTTAGQIPGDNQIKKIGGENPDNQKCAKNKLACLHVFKD
jgi:hypothetical protein